MAPSFLFLSGIIYTGLNILAFAVFTHDKLMAKINRGRIAENSLLFLAAFGPIGALTAMVGFRHKTHQVKFVLVPVFAILHLLLVVWLYPRIAG
ncbi:MAG: DUF1294 domain-containing protein [Methanoregula sp.]|nr:DUF1294 domain-containing protein [Methanoregula sp.]